MLSALSRALRMQPHGLASLLDELPLAPGCASPCVLHVCRYAQADAAAASSSTTAAAWTQGTEAHHDRGLLTVVVASEAEGLEVQSPTTGAWQRVVLAPGEAALFGGLSLEWATGGLLPAALHRVVSVSRRNADCWAARALLVHACWRFGCAPSLGFSRLERPNFPVREARGREPVRSCKTSSFPLSQGPWDR
jgi:hypothetical protein